MTNEQINEKIAEACGWKRVPEALGHDLWFCPLEPGIKPRGIRSSCPYYCNDLNAMHEAEKVLTGTQCVQYGDRLRAQYGPGAEVASFWGWHHGAAQRAEAFLRTLNLWEE